MALLAAYNFDETSGDVVDQSGNARGFPLGSELVRDASGHTGKGLGSATVGVTGQVASPAFGQSTDRTVMLWLKGDGDVWHIRWLVTSIDSGSWGLLSLSGTIGVQARNASDFQRAQATWPTDGAWHHVAATYQQSDGSLKLYLDGVLAATQTLTGPLRTDADLIDGFQWGSGTTVDDLRIYDTALDVTAIAALRDTPVSGTITHTVGQPAETSSATAVARRKLRSIGQAAETGSATAAGRRKLRVSGQAVEVGAAQPVGHWHVVTVGGAATTELAQPITPAKRVAVAAAGESGIARPVTRSKTATVAAAVEASTAGAVTARHVVRVTVGQAVEVGLAWGFALPGGYGVDPYGTSPYGSPPAGSRVKVRGLGRAVEVDRAADFRSAGERISPTVLAATNRPTATLAAGHGGARLEARHG